MKQNLVDQFYKKLGEHPTDSAFFSVCASTKNKSIESETSVRHTTRAHLVARAQNIADTLVDLPHQKWLVWADDAGDFFIQFLALILAHKHIIMPGNAKPGTLDELSTHYEAALVDVEAYALPQGTTKLCLTSFPSDTEFQQSLPLPKDVAITLFTSGTTGRPKAIDKSLALLLEELHVLEHVWGKTLRDLAVLHTVSHQHIYGLLHVCLWPFWRGAPFCTEINQYPEELAATATSFEQAMLVTSPTHIERLPQSEVFCEANQSICCYFSSTGLLTTSAAKAIHAVTSHNPIEIFGSTETGGVAYRQQRISPLWQALPGVNIEKHATGCLVVKSKHAGAAAQLMSDLVDIDEDGCFTLLGRQGTFVKVEGKRLSLNELRSKLESHIMVTHARVAVLKRKREEVVAVVVLAPETHTALRNGLLKKTQLNHRLKQHLAAHYETVLLPRRWRYVTALPQDAQGKTTLSDIKALFD